MIGCLRDMRNEIPCWSRLHFSKLPRSFTGHWGRKARLARKWLWSFPSTISTECRFYCICADTKALKQKNSHFRKDYHAYNRLTAMAAYCGLRYFYTSVKSFKCQIYSDKKSRPWSGLEYDNFEEYLPRRVSSDFQKRNGRLMDDRIEFEIADQVILLNSEPCADNGHLNEKCDLLQLTDILLGSVSQAVRARASSITKRALAMIAAEWMSDLRQRKNVQPFNLRRRFSVGFFPDGNGRISENVPLPILSDKNYEEIRGQLSLSLSN